MNKNGAVAIYIEKGGEGMVGAVEQRLLEQAQAGDRTAFDQLQIQLQPDLRRFIYKLVGPTDRADEFLQEAFLALYLKLDEFKHAGHVRFFLFRVARNLCYRVAPQGARTGDLVHA